MKQYFIIYKNGLKQHLICREWLWCRNSQNALP